MKILLTIMGLTIFVLGILIFLAKHTRLFLPKCKVCKQKREWFFYVGETNAKYNKDLGGCKIGDEILNGGDEVCNYCTKEYKLFDNYK